MRPHRIGLDVERGLAHLRRLDGQTDLTAKLQRVFARADEAAAPDPELALYSGFLNDADRRLLREVRATPPERLGSQRFAFRDLRLPELLWRYRARNWPELLNAEEAARWKTFCRERLERKTELTDLTFDDYFALIDTLRRDPAQAGSVALLDALQAYGLERRRELA